VTHHPYLHPVHSTLYTEHCDTGTLAPNWQNTSSQKYNDDISLLIWEYLTSAFIRLLYHMSLLNTFIIFMYPTRVSHACISHWHRSSRIRQVTLASSVSTCLSPKVHSDSFIGKATCIVHTVECHGVQQYLMLCGWGHLPVFTIRHTSRERNCYFATMQTKCLAQWNVTQQAVGQFSECKVVKAVSESQK
jgi:hypothetical protein